MSFPFAALAATSASAAGVAPAAGAAPDRGAALAENLGEGLARLAPEAGIAVVPSVAGPLVAPVSMRRADGLMVAISVAPALAEAVASARLGGAFIADPATGSAGSATALRARRAVLQACLDAVDTLWTTDGAGWSPVGTMPEGPVLGFEISAPGFAARVDLVIIEAAAAAAPAAGVPRADAAWQRGMRALLGATGLPLRAVLHERQVPLTQAVQLAPGDVLPIEAPRDVQLRIGTHKIARGTIAPLGDDGALLVTITSRRPDPAMLETLEVQP